MKNLMKTIGVGTALVGALAGCSGNGNVKGYNSNQSGEVYSSPVIKPEYGFKVIKRHGNVDEAKPIFIEHGNLYVVGFSGGNFSGQIAKNDARRNAASRAVEAIYGSIETTNKNQRTKIVNGNLFNFQCPKTEMIRIKDKNNNYGFIAETLCNTPLKNYPRKNQLRLKQKLMKGGQK